MSSENLSAKHKVDKIVEYIKSTDLLHFQDTFLENITAIFNILTDPPLCQEIINSSYEIILPRLVEDLYFNSRTLEPRYSLNFGITFQMLNFIPEQDYKEIFHKVNQDSRVFGRFKYALSGYNVAFILNPKTLQIVGYVYVSDNA
jgi:hypothetical protein